MSKVIKEIVMKYDKKSDKFVKEELDEKIDDFVQDIMEYRNEMINENKKNKDEAEEKKNKMISRFREDNAFWLNPSKKIEEIVEEDPIKVKSVKVTNFQCECGCYLIRKDGIERHKKTKKHENLLALKILKEQMEKLSIETTKNPPLGPVATKAPTLGGEISYISVEKSRKK